MPAAAFSNIHICESIRTFIEHIPLRLSLASTTHDGRNKLKESKISMTMLYKINKREPEVNVPETTRLYLVIRNSGLSIANRPSKVDSRT